MTTTRKVKTKPNAVQKYVRKQVRDTINQSRNQCPEPVVFEFVFPIKIDINLFF